jgi:hypothetical protein
MDPTFITSASLGNFDTYDKTFTTIAIMTEEPSSSTAATPGVD